MEGVHTPTIIRLILSTDLALIQLKDSLQILHFLNIYVMLERKKWLKS